MLALERHGIREFFSLLISILCVILHALFWMAWPPWYLLPLLGGCAQYLALA